MSFGGLAISRRVEFYKEEKRSQRRRPEASGTKATAQGKGNFEEGRGKNAAKGCALRVCFPSPYGAGLNCAAPTELRMVARIELLVGCERQKGGAGSKTPAGDPSYLRTSQRYKGNSRTQGLLPAFDFDS